MEDQTPTGGRRPPRSSVATRSTVTRSASNHPETVQGKAGAKGGASPKSAKGSRGGFANSSKPASGSQKAQDAQPDRQASTQGAADGSQASAPPAWAGRLYSAWRGFYSKNRYAVLYAVLAFVLVALLLAIGVWKTLLIAVFVAAGLAYGQYRDGNPRIVRFFAKLFSKRR